MSDPKPYLLSAFNRKYPIGKKVKVHKSKKYQDYSRSALYLLKRGKASTGNCWYW